MTATLIAVPSDKPVTSAEWLDLADKMLGTPGMYLTSSEWQTAVRGLAAALRHAMRLASMPMPASKPVLSLSAQLDTAQAEKFVIDLDSRAADASLPAAAYLLGLAEGHMQNLIEIIRTVTAL